MKSIRTRLARFMKRLHWIFCCNIIGIALAKPKDRMSGTARDRGPSGFKRPAAFQIGYSHRTVMGRALMCSEIKFAAGRAGNPVAEQFCVNGAAIAAQSVYGDEARTAVAYCALNARGDGRQDDYRFWVQVFRLLSPAH